MLLDKFSISAFGMGDVEKYGIDKVIEMALDKVDPKGKRSLHVSFDIDALDTLEAPSTGVPGKLMSGLEKWFTVSTRIPGKLALLA